MEKLKEDCIITDERLEYMKAIAELYVPNLEAEIYKNICTTTALPITVKKDTTKTNSKNMGSLHTKNMWQTKKYKTP